MSEASPAPGRGRLAYCSHSLKSYSEFNNNLKPFRALLRYLLNQAIHGLLFVASARLQGMDRGDVSAVRAALDRRHAVLTAVGTEAVDKRELTEQVTVSRSTVDRGVRELERLGLIERVNGGFRRTLVGTLALAEYDRATERLEALAAAADVLSHLPADVEVDPSVLLGADVVEATSETPYRPLSYQNELVRGADRIYACATAVVPPQVEFYYNELVENGLELTVITTDATLDLLVSEHYERLVNALDTGRCEMFLVDEPIHYSVVVAERPAGDEMLVSVYDDGIVGTIGNSRPEAVAWAEDRVEAYLADAEAVPRP